jgi:hypothetical protein
MMDYPGTRLDPTIDRFYFFSNNFINKKIRKPSAAAQVLGGSQTIYHGISGI